MIAVAYALCALTSLLATWLLFRAWRRNGGRLLLWSGLCFAGLTLNNLLTILDVFIVPDVDLWAARQIPAVIGLALLVGGLISEGQR